jgi:hypothetical protein
MMLSYERLMGEGMLEECEGVRVAGWQGVRVAGCVGVGEATPQELACPKGLGGRV